MKVYKLEFASRHKVVTTFIPTDWKIKDEKERLITIHFLIFNPPKKLKITFRIQKNCQNGQSITFAADHKYSHICPVWSAYMIFL
jgi:hypothetical protein